MKILFLPCWYPSEDNPVAGIFIKEHAKTVSLYHNVTVLYVYSSDKTKKIYEVSDKIEENIRTIRIRYKSTSFHRIDYLIGVWLIFLYFFKLVWKWGKPDIIQAHGYLLGVPAVILWKIYRIPVIITEHWFGFPLHMLNFFARARARFAMNRAKMILPVSKSLEESIKSYGIKSKFEVVPNVVNTEIFYPFQESKRNKNKKIILSVAGGLFTSEKGVSYLLKSLAQIKTKRGDFLSDIVGDGPAEKECEELADELNLNETVKFHRLKSKKEVAEFMRRSDFFD